MKPFDTNLFEVIRKSGKEFVEELLKDQEVVKILNSIDCVSYSQKFLDGIIKLVFEIDFYREVFDLLFPGITKEELKEMMNERNKRVGKQIGFVKTLKDDKVMTDEVIFEMNKEMYIFFLRLIRIWAFLASVKGYTKNIEEKVKKLVNEKKSFN